MLSEIKKKPGWERLVRLNQTFREVLWGVCKSKKLRSCLSLCGVRGSRPAGISRWAQVKKKVWTYSHISAGARLFRLKLTSSSVEKRDSLRSTVRFSPNFLRTVWMARVHNYPELRKRNRKETREGPFGPLVPPLHSLSWGFFFFFFKPHWCHWVCSS